MSPDSGDQRLHSKAYADVLSLIPGESMQGKSCVAHLCSKLAAVSELAFHSASKPASSDSNWHVCPANCFLHMPGSKHIVRQATDMPLKQLAWRSCKVFVKVVTGSIRRGSQIWAIVRAAGRQAISNVHPRLQL